MGKHDQSEFFHQEVASAICKKIARFIGSRAQIFVFEEQRRRFV
jgi:hypothetical protein